MASRLTKSAKDAKQASEPLTVSTTGACILTGYTVSHLRRLISAGRLDSPSPGQVSAESVGRFLKERLAANPYNEARTRLMTERATIARIKRERMEADLIPAADVAEAWAAIVEVVRQRILAVPVEVAPAVAASKDPAQVAAVLTDAVERALHELAATPVVVDTA